MSAAAPLPRWRQPWRILVAALALRLLTVAPALRSAPFSDEIAFHSLGQRLAAGQGFSTTDGRPTCWRPPLWPVALALVYRVTGPVPAAGRLLNVLLGTALVALICLLASQLPGDPRRAAVAGWWAAGSPTLIYYSHTLFSETFFGLWLAIALWALLRASAEHSRGWPLLAGLALALACLTRGSTLVLLPPALVWLTFADQRGWRHGAGQALLIALLVAALLAPWAARNRRVAGGPVLVDSNGAVNFFYGNNPRTPRLRPWEAMEQQPVPWPRIRPGAPDAELQRAALTEAAVYVRAYPLRFLLGLPLKTANLWGLNRGLAGGVASGLYGPAPTAVVLLAAAVDSAEGLALLLLGLLGLALTWGGLGELQVLVALALTLVHAASYGHSRYRFGALLLLYGYAAGALLTRRTWRADLATLPARRRRALVWAAAALLALWAVDLLVSEIGARLG